MSEVFFGNRMLFVGGGQFGFGRGALQVGLIEPFSQRGDLKLRGSEPFCKCLVLCSEIVLLLFFGLNGVFELAAGVVLLRDATFHVVDFVDQRGELAAAGEQPRGGEAWADDERAVGSHDFADHGDVVQAAADVFGKSDGS